jgi:hypothetical protein
VYFIILIFRNINWSARLFEHIFKFTILAGSKRSFRLDVQYVRFRGAECGYLTLARLVGAIHFAY